MPQIISTDGTMLSYETRGSGPALVLVHGSIADRRVWNGVIPALAQQCTVYAFDRRGRGDSGDAPAHSMAQEAEDVAALIDTLGEPVTLVAHSYGAICSLEAALLTSNVRRLVLYEPPIQLTPRPEADRFFLMIDELIAHGDRDGAVANFYRHIMRMPQDDLERLRARPVWANLLAVAHTIPRELRAVGSYAFQPERFGGLAVPTLLLQGGATRREGKAVIDALHQAIPDSRVVTLDGQGHSAMSTAPKLFTETVLRFLREPE